jgi:hypothetical protein
MKTLIQAAEVWMPDAEGYLLEFGSGLYDGAVEFGAISRSMCFGRGEGLPGRAWEQAQPILLTDLQAAHFRRATAAKQAGLVCALAIPCYFGALLKAVVVLFCGGGGDGPGAVEVWEGEPGTGLQLAEGYFGATSPSFAAASRAATLAPGQGLPGLAWQQQRSVFIDGLPHSPLFQRAEAAQAAGLDRGLAFPCPVPGPRHYVLSLLSAAALPIARRLESWVPDPAGQGLQRAYGYCEQAGALPVGAESTSAGSGEDSIALAYATAVPQLRAKAAAEPGAVGEAAAAAGLGSVAVLPIVHDGAVVEALALYF